MKPPTKSTRKLVAAIPAPLLLALIFTASAALPPGPAADPPKLRALVVTGDDVPAHNWRETTPVVREILEATGRFEVRVSEEPAVLATPALSHYDVVVLNYRDGDGRGPGEEARRNLREFVARGKGLVAVHFAVCAFRDWKEFQDLVGRTWVAKQSGHGPRGKFKVSIAPGDDPITAGLSDFEADDELYAALGGAKELKVLATAVSADFSKKTEPMAWTIGFEKGRVFATVLGHDARARRIPAFGTLLGRGTEWAASGKVTVK